MVDAVISLRAITRTRHDMLCRRYARISMFYACRLLQLIMRAIRAARDTMMRARHAVCQHFVFMPPPTLMREALFSP